MLDKKLLYNLYYKQRLSMVKIADKLNINPSKAYYWLKQYDFPRRSQSESSYAKQNPIYEYQKEN